jgi:Beta/Gamma crystallin
MKARLAGEAAPLAHPMFLLDSTLYICSNDRNPPLMRKIPKTELSPDNGCIIDTKWTLGPLSYHASAAGKVKVEPSKEIIRLPEIVLYDDSGFGGAYARTNLSFHYIGDFWNDRISCLIVVSGVWRFYRDDYYKGPYWDLGPGYYESFFAEKGPDDVVSSFQAIALT